MAQTLFDLAPQEESDTLIFEPVSVNDSLIADVKIVDYSSDADPAPYTMGKSRNYYNVQTLEAVGGKPEAVEFINQWLTIEAADEGVDDPVDAENVRQSYAKLKAAGVDTPSKALARASKNYLGEGAPMDEMGWETGNSLEADVHVEWNTKTILTLGMNGYDYPAGAAHGMPWDYCQSFDLKHLRALNLDDIFVQQGRKTLLGMVVRQLVDEYGESGMMSAPKDIDFPGVAPALMEDGVIFCYGAYEIGAYALGLPSVTLPYDKVKPYLTPEVQKLLDEK